MSKGLAWFLGFLLLAVVAFVVTVLVLASQHGLTFIQEIQSWFPATEVTDTIVETVSNIRLIA